MHRIQLLSSLSVSKVDERNLYLSRENAEIINKIEDGEDEVEEIIKKNKQLTFEVIDVKYSRFLLFCASFILN